MKKSAALVAGTIMALGMGTPAVADADTAAVAMDSEGDFSGNVVQVPVSVPVNVCGNTINVIGLLNPASGNECESD
ncbi:chaplin family protein [Streptomyces sp. HMX87]|uniref:chaplin family protein n=1 Tax=Streptomyces sp. HMX87 TaxID=3390849 RepID=UPI003A8723B0